MRTIALGFACMLAAAATPVHAQQPQPSPLEALAWLAGCWAADPGEPGSGEHWLPLAGGTMLGIGRTVRNGRTVEHEFLQIRLDGEGRPVYVALPSRQKEASFVATHVGERTVTFENPQHDFPQRISYRALPQERMLARIEGPRGGVMRAIDFPMKRVPCEVPGGQLLPR